ncbi:L-aspartate oxidase [Candidatus Poribacteria bacterium]|nr:L-aspartate oxidase [Candidatus Poribacteria bacterium]
MRHGTTPVNPTPPAHCPRYLLPFDMATVRRVETDYLVIGSGNAGLRASMEVSDHGRVIVLSKENPNEGSTRYAQGGIAVVMNQGDRVEFHVQDTLSAGAGLCHPAAVQYMVADGILRVQELLDWGAQFDRDGADLKFGMEGAHRVRRVVHRGDATGEETQNVLVRRALDHPNVEVMEHTLAVDLLTADGVCRGALVTTQDGELIAIIAKATIVAAGGHGQVYGYTSNPAVATGDGIAMSFRAGAAVADMEFVQFHPTTLFLQGAPRFLISEAVRGEGAHLLNSRGERFMSAYDEREELAPRDIVARAILNEMDRTGMPCVYLDITHMSAGFLEERFPNIFETCRQYGLEIDRDAIPVQVAAHFAMGGVRTDMNAHTSVPGLFACGEVACTCAHGANRLASNSLLEGLVFGRRAGISAREYSSDEGASLPDVDALAHAPDVAAHASDASGLRKLLTQRMWEDVGVYRHAETLREALTTLSELPTAIGSGRDAIEYANMRLVGELIARAALERTESRGAHYRDDYPDTDDDRWLRNISLTRREDGGVELTTRNQGLS